MTPNKRLVRVTKSNLERAFVNSLPNEPIKALSGLEMPFKWTQSKCYILASFFKFFFFFNFFIFEWLLNVECQEK